jgi:hypothetical protein
MSNSIVEKGDGTEIKMQEKTEITFERAKAEFDRALAFIQAAGISESRVFMILAAEMLHWLYAKPGEHETPYAMFVTIALEVKERAGATKSGGSLKYDA